MRPSNKDLDKIDRASLISSSSSSSSSSDGPHNTTVIEAKSPKVRPCVRPLFLLKVWSKTKQNRFQFPFSFQKRNLSMKEDSSDSDDDIEFLYEQNFFEIRDECLKEKRLFEDPEFPADDDLLRSRSGRHVEDLEWLRPRDFCKTDEPILVSNRNEGFDIRVGLDSWFVPSMSAVAESEAMLGQVVPKDQGFTEKEKYAGIFHFRFWFGRWIEIVVDDRLPVKKDEPLYMKVISDNL